MLTQFKSAAAPDREEKTDGNWRQSDCILHKHTVSFLQLPSQKPKQFQASLNDFDCSLKDGETFFLQFPAQMFQISPGI